MAPKAASRPPASRSSIKPPSTNKAIKPASTNNKKRSATDGDAPVASPNSKAPASKKAKVDENPTDEGLASGSGKPKADVIQEEGEGNDVEMKGNDDAAKEIDGNGKEYVAMQNEEPSSSTSTAKAAAPAPQENNSNTMDVDPSSTSTDSAKRGRGRPSKSTLPNNTNSSSKPYDKPPANKTVAKLAAGEGKKKDAMARRSVGGGSVGGSSRRVGTVALDLPKAAEKLRPARSLLIWGNGDMGQLGLGDDNRDEIYRPKVHEWFEQAIKDGKLGGEGAGLEAVAAGGMHSVVVDEAGRVWTWGVNDNGALGRRTAKVLSPPDQADTRTDPENQPDTRTYLNNDELETTPMLVEELAKEGYRAVKVAAGDNVSLAIDDKGEVRYWGSFRGSEGLLGFGGVGKAMSFEPVPLPKACLRTHTQFVDVASGENHVLLLGTDGKVLVFGDNVKGQLGRKISPRRTINGTIPEPLAIRNVQLIAAGPNHSLAVDKDGRVFAWGLNGNGQCGISQDRINLSWAEEVVEVPTLIDQLLPERHNGSKVIALSAGSFHSLFLFDDGSVWSCGGNTQGQLGVADDHPAMPEAAKNVSEPVQVFFPPPPTEDDKNPALAPYEDTDEYRKASSRVQSIDSGVRFNLAITTDGRMYSWGEGLSAELGLGNSITEQKTPALIRSPAANNVVVNYKPLSCNAGGQHCMVLAQKRTEVEA